MNKDSRKLKKKLKKKRNGIKQKKIKVVISKETNDLMLKYMNYFDNKYIK